MITLTEAKTLVHGQVLYHTYNRNSDGTPQRWRVNGKVRVWRRSPERVQVPLKHGLRDYDYLTERYLSSTSLTEEGARNGTA